MRAFSGSEKTRRYGTMAGELISTSEAAATLTAGVDAFRNERKSVSSRPRRVDGFSVVGANAINEAEVDIHAGDYFFGRFRNSRAGVAAAIMPDDMQPVRAVMVAPGDKLTATIVTIPTVSPLLIKVYGREF
jgi:hypothetical protein